MSLKRSSSSSAKRFASKISLRDMPALWNSLSSAFMASPMPVCRTKKESVLCKEML
jgi:hypothetical protein